MATPINIQTVKSILPWVNSAKNFENMVDCLLERLKKEKPELRPQGTSTPVPVKSSISDQDVMRIEKVCSWVRDYQRWKKERDAIGAPSGTKAFLDQLDQPAPPPFGPDGKRRNRERYQ